MEEFRIINGYDGEYLVSNKGNIVSVKNKKKKELKKTRDTYGYEKVRLYKNGIGKTVSVHILVAEAFISNPNMKDVVNHKDENRSNNDVENLEWCDKRYNLLYGTSGENLGKGNIRVKQIDNSGNTIKIWESLREAKKHNFYEYGIKRCCNKIIDNYKGFKWEYA